jgi:hypothetical protein
MKNKAHPYYYFGGFIGLILGYIIAKIYQIWVIVYLSMDDLRINVLPIFKDVIIDNPALFTFGVVLVFVVIGVTFVRILLSASEKRSD